MNLCHNYDYLHIHSSYVEGTSSSGGLPPHVVNKGVIKILSCVPSVVI